MEIEDEQKARHLGLHYLVYFYNQSKGNGTLDAQPPLFFDELWRFLVRYEPFFPECSVQIYEIKNDIQFRCSPGVATA